MALLIMITTIVTYSPLGSPHANYLTHVEKIKLADCLIIKKAIDKRHVVTCIKEAKQ
jgi:hypothetical protein